MEREKITTICKFVLGVFLVVAGVVFMIKSQDSHVGYTGGLSRTSTSIEFGADFYTTSAQYTGLAANAVCDLYTMTTMGFGILFVFVGGIDLCMTGPKLKKVKK